jgi:putative DNA primase/helicase
MNEATLMKDVVQNAVRVIPLKDGVVLTCGASLKPQPVQWLWPGWLALGKFHLLAGAPGQGKTTIAMALCATVTDGGRWPDGSRCEPGNVLVWSGEDDPADTLLPRLMASGADVSRVHFITGARLNGELQGFDPARDMQALQQAAERIGQVRLIVVDPVVSAVACDSHKNGETRRALQPLVDLATNLNAALLGITHFSKGGQGGDPSLRVLGSVAFTAVARVVMVAAKVKDDEGKDRRILARSKSNIGPDEGGFEYHLEQSEPQPGIHASHVTWGQAVEGSARELLTDPNEDARERSSTGSDADDALRRFIGTDTVPKEAVVAAMRAEGFTLKMVRNAFERAGVQSKRSGFGAEMKAYWSLPHGTELPQDESPVTPTESHSCPVMPTKTEGTNGHD